jgi:hypothetical protein
LLMAIPEIAMTLDRQLEGKVSEFL